MVTATTRAFTRLGNEPPALEAASKPIANSAESEDDGSPYRRREGNINKRHIRKALAMTAAKTAEAAIRLHLEIPVLPSRA